MGKFIRSVDKNYIELSGRKKAETEKAIPLWDGKTEAWIPKSQIEDMEEEGEGFITITIPEWLGADKGLI